MKKYVKYIASIILIATTIVCILLYGPMLRKDEYSHRQVQAIAPSESNLLLDFYPHISQVPRPKDPYPFPINLGQIGPSTNLYSGPNQYPFFCMTVDSGLGQPEVDNQQGYGVAVFDQHNKVIGYSKDCALKTKLEYYTLDKSLTPKQLGATQAKHHQGPLFRVERGTINRFIYTLIMPISNQEVGDRLTQSQWNKRLIYQFNGGSGIGYRQGRQHAWKVMQRQAQQLLDGYAVISSSGNKTSYTYNMLLAEDTARRVKKQFTSLYGEPLYTVGVGGSGGGLAQYLIAQNSSGILDGLIPLYSYPDMITQTTYALDCDLLNNYFTFRADNRKSWLDWERRRLIEGMNAINDFPQRAGFLQPLNQLMAGFVPSFPDGNSECINGYFGLSAFINNPKQGFLRQFFAKPVIAHTNWSYWQDMQHILGTNKQGFGLSTWDNVGVQYGINALLNQQISMDEFLDINRQIGAWKAQEHMHKEHIITPLGTKVPLWLSLWGSDNITQPQDGVAPRHHGSVKAMQAAYRSGQVFLGKVHLPIIDARHYLENELDMHHMSASFYSRLRIEKMQGHSKNHIIWVAHKEYDPTVKAFAMMDEWLLSIKHGTPEEVVKAKPKALKDSCFNEDGSVYSAGPKVFDGQWNNRIEGQCQSRFPMYSTSRIEAGAPWAGDMFKCALINVELAITRGIYGTNLSEQDVSALKTIFAQGVCDYSQGDIGRPKDI
ncbi:hypothetical protein PSECIP111951_00043 [Pseudoalteromonas holothuriae]|uniref:DUF6351 domain-containing protein n=1 Tax=Pseudoalteromonas holothuriae TaxID=2963714 RepID=A0ABM9GDK8_9GAMM|nr:DUF6351 family protein [Pseudoalteromonas sp. CIP111951]CAH9049818.1 hypothetical protein PSECIP111951_00043 [Pseudoalteromonas sp. CIP111951]